MASRVDRARTAAPPFPEPPGPSLHPKKSAEAPNLKPFTRDEETAFLPKKAVEARFTTKEFLGMEVPVGVLYLFMQKFLGLSSTISDVLFSALNVDMDALKRNFETDLFLDYLAAVSSKVKTPEFAFLDPYVPKINGFLRSFKTVESFATRVSQMVKEGKEKSAAFRAQEIDTYAKELAESYKHSKVSFFEISSESKKFLIRIEKDKTVTVINTESLHETHAAGAVRHGLDPLTKNPISELRFQQFLTLENLDPSRLGDVEFFRVLVDMATRPQWKEAEWDHVDLSALIYDNLLHYLNGQMRPALRPNQHPEVYKKTANSFSFFDKPLQTALYYTLLGVFDKNPTSDPSAKKAFKKLKFLIDKDVLLLFAELFKTSKIENLFQFAPMLGISHQTLRSLFLRVSSFTSFSANLQRQAEKITLQEKEAVAAGLSQKERDKKLDALESDLGRMHLTIQELQASLKAATETVLNTPVPEKEPVHENAFNLDPSEATRNTPASSSRDRSMAGFSQTKNIPVGFGHFSSYSGQGTSQSSSVEAPKEAAKALEESLTLLDTLNLSDPAVFAENLKAIIQSLKPALMCLSKDVWMSDNHQQILRSDQLYFVLKKLLMQLPIPAQGEAPDFLDKLSKEDRLACQRLMYQLSGITHLVLNKGLNSIDSALLNEQKYTVASVLQAGCLTIMHKLALKEAGGRLKGFEMDGDPALFSNLKNGFALMTDDKKIDEQAQRILTYFYPGFRRDAEQSEYASRMADASEMLNFKFFKDFLFDFTPVLDKEFSDRAASGWIQKAMQSLMGPNPDNITLRFYRSLIRWDDPATRKELEALGIEESQPKIEQVFQLIRASTTTDTSLIPKSFQWLQQSVLLRQFSLNDSYFNRSDIPAYVTRLFDASEKASGGFLFKFKVELNKQPLPKKPGEDPKKPPETKTVGWTLSKDEKDLPGMFSPGQNQLNQFLVYDGYNEPTYSTHSDLGFNTHQSQNTVIFNQKHIDYFAKHELHLSTEDNKELEMILIDPYDRVNRLINFTKNHLPLLGNRRFFDFFHKVFFFDSGISSSIADKPDFVKNIAEFFDIAIKQYAENSDLTHSDLANAVKILNTAIAVRKLLLTAAPSSRETLDRIIGARISGLQLLLKDTRDHTILNAFYKAQLSFELSSLKDLDPTHQDSAEYERLITAYFALKMMNKGSDFTLPDPETNYRFKKLAASFETNLETYLEEDDQRKSRFFNTILGVFTSDKEKLDWDTRRQVAEVYTAKGIDGSDLVIDLQKGTLTRNGTVSQQPHYLKDIHFGSLKRYFGYGSDAQLRDETHWIYPDLILAYFQVKITHGSSDFTLGDPALDARLKTLTPFLEKSIKTYLQDSDRRDKFLSAILNGYYGGNNPLVWTAGVQRSVIYTAMPNSGSTLIINLQNCTLLQNKKPLEWLPQEILNNPVLQKLSSMGRVVLNRADDKDDPTLRYKVYSLDLEKGLYVELHNEDYGKTFSVFKEIEGERFYYLPMGEQDPKSFLSNFIPADLIPQTIEKGAYVWMRRGGGDVEETILRIEQDEKEPISILYRKAEGKEKFTVRPLGKEEKILADPTTIRPELKKMLAAFSENFEFWKSAAHPDQLHSFSFKNADFDFFMEEEEGQMRAFSKQHPGYFLSMTQGINLDFLSDSQYLILENEQGRKKLILLRLKDSKVDLIDYSIENEQLFPSTITSRLNLAQLFLKSGEVASALKQLREINPLERFTEKELNLLNELFILCIGEGSSQAHTLALHIYALKSHNGFKFPSSTKKEAGNIMADFGGLLMFFGCVGFYSGYLTNHSNVPDFALSPEEERYILKGLLNHFFDGIVFFLKNSSSFLEKVGIHIQKETFQTFAFDIQETVLWIAEFLPVITQINLPFLSNIPYLNVIGHVPLLLQRYKALESGSSRMGYVPTHSFSLKKTSIFLDEKSAEGFEESLPNYMDVQNRIKASLLESKSNILFLSGYSNDEIFFAFYDIATSGTREQKERLKVLWDFNRHYLKARISNPELIQAALYHGKELPNIDVLWSERNTYRGLLAREDRLLQKKEILAFSINYYHPKLPKSFFSFSGPEAELIKLKEDYKAVVQEISELQADKVKAFAPFKELASYNSYLNRMSAALPRALGLGLDVLRKISQVVSALMIIAYSVSEPIISHLTFETFKGYWQNRFRFVVDLTNVTAILKQASTHLLPMDTKGLSTTDAVFTTRLKELFDAYFTHESVDNTDAEASLNGNHTDPLIRERLNNKKAAIDEYYKTTHPKKIDRYGLHADKNIDDLMDTLKQESAAWEKTLEENQEKLLFKVNSVSEDLPSRISLMVRKDNAATSVSWDELKTLFLSGDEESFKKLTYLSQADIQELFRDMGTYLVQYTRYQQIQKAVANLEKIRACDIPEERQNLIGDCAKQLLQSRAYELTMKNRGILLLEMSSGYLCRKRQIQVIQDIAGKIQGLARAVLVEAPTGEGKTSVYDPLLNAMLAGNHLIINAWPGPLEHTNTADNQQKIKGSFGIDVDAIHFDRSINATSNDFNAIYSELLKNIALKRPLNLRPETLIALQHQMLILQELAKNSYVKGELYAQIEALQKILRLTRLLGIAIIDEAHFSLDTKKQKLIYTTGKAKVVSDEEIGVIEYCFNLLTSKELAPLVGVHENKQAELSAKDYREKVVPKLVKGLQSRLKISNAQYQEFADFVTDADRSYTDPVTKKTSHIPLWLKESAYEQEICLARGMISMLLLPCLQGHVDQSFGLSHKHIATRRFAIPYVNSNTPKENDLNPSQYQNPHETFIKTYLIYLYKGLSLSQAKEVIDFLKEQAAAQIEIGTALEETEAFKTFNQIFSFEHPDGERLPSLLKINDKDVEYYYKNIQMNKAAIFAFIRCIVKNEVSLYERTVVGTPQNFKSLFAKTISMTATPQDTKAHGKDTTFRPMKGTAGQVLHLLYKKCRDSHATIKTLSSTLKADILKVTTDLIGDDPKMRAIIDVGGHLRGIKNKTVAESLREHFSTREHIQEIIYFDEVLERFMVMNVKTGNARLLDDAKVDPQVCFALYDQNRIFGSDLKLSPDAVGLVLVDKESTITAIGQAIGRLRGLPAEQKIILAIPESQQQEIFADHERNVETLARYFIGKDAQYNAAFNYEAICDQINNELRSALVDKLLGIPVLPGDPTDSDEPQNINQSGKLFAAFESELFHKQSFQPFDLYANASNEIDTRKELSRHVKRVIARVQALKGLSSAEKECIIGRIEKYETLWKDKTLPFPKKVAGATAGLGLECEVSTHIETQAQQETMAEEQTVFPKRTPIPWDRKIDLFESGWEKTSYLGLSIFASIQRIRPISDIVGWYRGFKERYSFIMQIVFFVVGSGVHTWFVLEYTKIYIIAMAIFYHKNIYWMIKYAWTTPNFIKGLPAALKKQQGGDMSFYRIQEVMQHCLTNNFYKGFSPDLLVTRNFYHLSRGPSFSSQDPFTWEQKPVYQILFILDEKDGKKTLQAMIGDQNDTVFWRSKFKEDFDADKGSVAARTRKLAIYDLKSRTIVAQGQNGFAPGELEKQPQFTKLVTQAKVVGGYIDYNDDELKVVSQMLKKTGSQEFIDFFTTDVLKSHPVYARCISKPISPLGRLFHKETPLKRRKTAPAAAAAG